MRGRFRCPASGHPPVGLAAQFHHRGDEDHPDDGGVDEHGDGHAEASLLDRDVGAEQGGGEDGDHDGGRGCDDLGGPRQSSGNGRAGVSGSLVLLTDP